LKLKKKIIAVVTAAIPLSVGCSIEKITANTDHEVSVKTVVVLNEGWRQQATHIGN